MQNSLTNKDNEQNGNIVYIPTYNLYMQSRKFTKCGTCVHAEKKFALLLNIST